ncbi:MAG: hypothetical protein ACC628_24515 [Pirellulaceae bacterium]
MHRTKLDGIGEHRNSRFADTVFVLLVMLASAPTALMGQNVTGLEAVPIFLPQVRGTTALSAAISARAEALHAAGHFLVNRAEARKKNAEAAEREMDNAVKWVDTYFGRQELNRMYRKAKNPPHLDRVLKRYQATERLILESPEEILKGDPTSYLNWMLNELSTAEIALTLPADGLQPSRDVDPELSPNAIRHIRLTDGGYGSGKRLAFRADTGEIFEVRWPYSLRGPEFASARDRMEEARKQFVAEIHEQGDYSVESAQRLRKGVDDLVDLYATHYPPEVVFWSDDRDTIQVYWIGRRFLEHLAAAVARAIVTNDMRLFDGSYRFEGESIMDLIRHLCQSGLQFAHPEPGDEGTYRDVFRKMRHIYNRHSEFATRRELEPTPE